VPGEVRIGAMAAETLPPDKEIYKAAEVCKAADAAPYVLRYWQTEFPVLAQSKDKSPNRTYTRREVKIIARIRQLLYDEGFTIAGAKKKIEVEISTGAFDARGRESRAAAPAASPAPASARPSRPVAEPAAPAAPPAAKAAPGLDRKSVAKELREVLKMLEGKPRR
jgi:DNA-binding transcriptional MerR regulator